MDTTFAYAKLVALQRHCVTNRKAAVPHQLDLVHGRVIS
jgi:hypothetical protein